MPIHPDTPEPLKSALEWMEAFVQKFKTDLLYTAPEMLDHRYAELQQGLADVLITLYEETGEADAEVS